MGETYTEIPDYLIQWILEQQMFWVASAPLSSSGHVNISPKGVEGTFHVESPTRVWYEDLSGSGAETIAHIRENGRVTVLFNAFKGPPRIARLYGKGHFYELGSPEYNALLPPGIRQPGSRAIIVIDVYKVGTTCGYAVPYYSFLGHRVPLLDWAAKKEATDLSTATAEISSPTSSTSSKLEPTANTCRPLHPNGLLSWWETRNTVSLDGLPALSSAFKQPPSSLGTFKEIIRPLKSSGSNTVAINVHGEILRDALSKGTELERTTLGYLVSFTLGVLATVLYTHLRTSIRATAVVTGQRTFG